VTSNIKTPLPSSSKGVPQRHRRKGGRPKGKPVLDAKTVREHIERGYNPAIIARKFGVSREAATQAVARSQRAMLAEMVMRQSERTTVPLPEVAPATTGSPIDIMGEVMSVIEDVRAFRAWLVSEEAKRIPLHRRLEYFQKVWDTKLHWADRFIQVYSKLLDLIAFDTWLRDILDIAERVAPGSREQIKAQLRDRLYGRVPDALVAPNGTSPPSSPTPLDTSSTSSPPT
jgi:hypothetical protein